LKPRKIDWLFIDAEGAELEILEASRNTISSMKPKMFVETHPCFVLEINVAVVEYLQRFGYTSHAVYQDQNLVVFKFTPNIPNPPDFCVGKSGEPVI
jgi:hypothetical protein